MNTRKILPDCANILGKEFTQGRNQTHGSDATLGQTLWYGPVDFNPKIESALQTIKSDHFQTRTVTAEQKKSEEMGVTEDDVNEIKQDISSFRFELLDILRNNGMKCGEAEKGNAGTCPLQICF